MASIELHTRILAPMNHVFDALTQAELLKRWFTPDLIAFPKEKTTAAFAIGDINFKMLIQEVKAPEKLVWECVDGNVDWLDSSITFSLVEQEGQTSLEFLQSDLPETDKLKLWTASWDNYLYQLKDLCENQSLD